MNTIELSSRIQYQIDDDYEPNFKDPRVIKKCNKAFNFVFAFVPVNGSRQISIKIIEVYFGQTQNNLSKYLHKHLLICTNDYYSKNLGIAKEYSRNVIGLEYLISKIDPNSLKIDRRETEDIVFYNKRLGDVSMKGYYDGIFFASLLELNYMIHCDKINVSYKRFDSQKIVYNFNGKCHTYTPDFILTETNDIIEIKYSNMINDELNLIKFEAAKNVYGEKFKVVTEINFKRLSIREIYELNDDKIVFSQINKFKELVRIQKLSSMILAVK